MYGYIYRTTNLINNKIYIGKKEKPHYVDGYFGSGVVIRRALAKYGVDNFKCEILEWCEDLDSLNLAEQRHIASHDSFWNIGKGYNVASGGDGGGHMRTGWDEARKKEHIKLKSLQNSGKKNPNYGNGDKIRGEANPSKREDVKLKLSQANSGKNNAMYGKCGKESPRFGTTHNAETRKKISESLKNVVYTTVCKECNTEFTSNSARRTYCNDVCKRKYRDKLKG